MFAAIRKGVDQPHRAGADQARRKRAREIREGLGEFRRRHQGGALRGSRAARRAVQDRPLRHDHASRRRPHARRLCRRARENQTAIYYLTGDDAKRLAASPQLEGFRARGVEVLLLADPVDAFWVSTAAGFDGKPFKSVSQGAADIKIDPARRGRDAAGREPSAEVATLSRIFKQTLGERDRGRARLRPAGRQRRLSGRAGVRPRPPAREDARRARAAAATASSRSWRSTPTIR